MLTVACLLNDTQLEEDIKSLVEFYAFDMAANDGYAPLARVYNAIVNDGIEVDIRTVGRIYADSLPLHEAAFNDMDEIDDVVGDYFRNLVNAVTNLPDRNKSSTTGPLSPEEAVSNSLGQLFWIANSVSDETKSDMKIMQDALLKGARRLLGELPKPASNQKEWQDVINQALAIDNMGVPTLYGSINSMETLFDALKDELRHITDAITNPARKAQFEQYVNSLQTASYALMLSKTEAKKLLIDIMKEAGFSKILPNGNTVLDWNKLSGFNNSIVDIRNNVQKVLQDKGYNKSEINAVKAGLVQEFANLHAEILDKAQKQLIRQGSTALKSQMKSSLQKMVELNQLGVFTSAHNKALLKLLGVDDLTQQNIDKIAQIVDLMEGLTRDIKQDTFRGKEFFASHAYKTLRRQISDIIANNITDKAAILRFMRGLDYYFQIKATGMIMNYGNLFENNLSAMKEVMAANINQAVNMGPSAMLKDWDLWAATFKDVAQGGIVYGDVGTSFGDFSKAEHTISKKKNALTKALYYLMAPARYFLTGSDSAFKAVLTRKTFQLNIHQALVQSGMSKDEASRFINEALYGQSFEKAKQEAAFLLEKYGLPTDKNSIIRMADDWVRANLMADQRITLEMLHAAHKSAYEVAGIGMGHLSQKRTIAGFVANILSDIRKNRNTTEIKLSKEGNYNQLAEHKFYSTLFEQGTLFLGGRLNWLELRIQSTGWGIITGKFGGKSHAGLDLTSEKGMEETMFDVRDANQRIYRGIVGLMYLGTFASILAGIAAALRDPDDESFLAFKSLMRKINNNSVARRMFKKIAPEFFLMWFYKTIARADAGQDVEAQEAAKWAMMGSYAEDVFNIGDKYGAGTKLQNAFSLAKSAYKQNGNVDQKAMAKAKGIIGDVIGSSIEIPLWRPYKSYYQAVRLGNAPQTFRPAYDVVDGVMKGGMLEDLGFWKNPKSIISVTGIGSKKEAALKAQGINTADELIKTPNWQYLRDNKGELIFSKRDRESIDSTAKQW